MILIAELGNLNAGHSDGRSREHVHHGASLLMSLGGVGRYRSAPTDYFENLPAKNPTTISRKLVTKSNAAERIVNCSRIITPAAVARATPLRCTLRLHAAVHHAEQGPRRGQHPRL